MLHAAQTLVYKEVPKIWADRGYTANAQGALIGPTGIPLMYASASGITTLYKPTVSQVSTAIAPTPIVSVPAPTIVIPQVPINKSTNINVESKSAPKVLPAQVPTIVNSVPRRVEQTLPEISSKVVGGEESMLRILHTSKVPQPVEKVALPEVAQDYRLVLTVVSVGVLSYLLFK